MARHVETAADVLAANVLGVEEGHDVYLLSEEVDLCLFEVGLLCGSLSDLCKFAAESR
jgi:hypothetical protein